jgi:hypothetical protein
MKKKKFTFTTNNIRSAISHTTYRMAVKKRKMIRLSVIKTSGNISLPNDVYRGCNLSIPVYLTSTGKIIISLKNGRREKLVYSSADNHVIAWIKSNKIPVNITM